MQETPPTEENVFHDLNKNPSGMSVSPKVLVLFVAVIVVGIVVGYLASRISRNSANQMAGVSGGKAAIAGGQVYGSNDLTTFKDTAEGTLQSGGIDGDGQYHLVRPGGDSQSVYLTSSIVDLSQFTGRKVKVWGQTQAAQHAGWLMDVGRVEVE